eukprot:TRINITY_DN10994_c0_g1_i1.p2 TRINITY_DN10994_c0_g1~~TRINITY_DN10994_c0_g1_i1.p2  ORF type:complete len:150 (+),score=32.03 TRINITY_DN10994_c0_g1_i1:102-551(+)
MKPETRTEDKEIQHSNEQRMSNKSVKHFSGEFPKEIEEQYMNGKGNSEIIQKIDDKLEEIYNATSSLFVPNKQSIRIKDMEAATKIVGKVISQDLPNASAYIQSKLPTNTSILPLSDYIELLKEHLLPLNTKSAQILEQAFKDHLLELK